MSKVLLLSVPSHGHVNPTLGLVNELVKNGEEVVYFSSIDFKEKIEEAGATFKCYCEDLDIFKVPDDSTADPMLHVIGSAATVIADILEQIEGIQFQYIIHSAPFPFARPIAQILQLPTVSSLGIFAGIGDFLAGDDGKGAEVFPGMEEMMDAYNKASLCIKETYSVDMPDNVMDLLMNKGDINLVYTSEYFIAPADKAWFDDTFKFVGPPVFERKENLDFPFERLEGRKVIYISLGTVFSNFNLALYSLFFSAFADMDAVIVMAAYHVDLSQFTIPANFIVRNYIPQSALLKYADAAITHAGMNSISDLTNSNIPFVCIPLGADQPNLASRAEELGATIALDAATLTPAVLRASVEAVLADPSYLESIRKISTSFNEAGGYKKAVEEIFLLKERKGIY